MKASITNTYTASAILELTRDELLFLYGIISKQMSPTVDRHLKEIYHGLQTLYPIAQLSKSRGYGRGNKPHSTIPLWLRGKSDEYIAGHWRSWEDQNGN